MMTTRYNFEEVSLKAVRRWTDESGKKRQQTKKFMQTISPFNKNADGSLKDRKHIMAELVIQRDAWIQESAP